MDILIYLIPLIIFSNLLTPIWGNLNLVKYKSVFYLLLTIAIGILSLLIPNFHLVILSLCLLMPFLLIAKTIDNNDVQYRFMLYFAAIILSVFFVYSYNTNAILVILSITYLLIVFIPGSSVAKTPISLMLFLSFCAPFLAIISVLPTTISPLLQLKWLLIRSKDPAGQVLLNLILGFFVYLLTYSISHFLFKKENSYLYSSYISISIIALFFTPLNDISWGIALMFSAFAGFLVGINLNTKLMSVHNSMLLFVFAFLLFVFAYHFFRYIVINGIIMSFDDIPAYYLTSLSFPVGISMGILKKNANRNQLFSKNREIHLTVDSPIPNRKRDWNSLPSVTIIAVTPWVSGSTIVDSAFQASTDLICVGYDKAPLKDEDIRRQIELSYEFSENPRLVAMMLQFNRCLLLRRTFLVEHADELAPAAGFNDFTERLNKVGRKEGYACRVISK